MSAESRVAVRYAKAVVEVAREKGNFEQLKTDMDLIKNTFKGDHELKVVLLDPVIENNYKLNILNGIFADKVGEETRNLFQLVCKKNRAGVMPYLAQSVIDEYYRINNIEEATVTTPFALTEELRKSFIQKAEKICGKSIQLIEKVDPSLIGGYILNVSGKQVDQSVSSQLSRLKKTMMAR